jgi:hypothetical protein
MRHITGFVATMLAVACASDVSAQDHAQHAVASHPEVAPGTAQAQVLVLGVYHFANPGLDVVKVDVADVLSPAKQAEIREVLEGLARFRPTKIAVEQVRASAVQLDSLYNAFRAGDHELTRNETQQLGFRLADQFGHPRVYPIDHRGEFPFGPVMQYAQQHDPAFVTLAQNEMVRMTAEGEARQRECTIGEILHLSNTPAKLASDHGMYMQFSRVGAGDTYPGADLLSKWYDRNIRIFANVQAVAEPGDRILVIVGSGHAPILRELIGYDPILQLADPLEYLPAAGTCR